MKEEAARQLVEAAEAARAALDTAVAHVTTVVSAEAGEQCSYYLTGVYVDLGLRLLSPLYDEHPALNKDVGPTAGARPLQIPQSALSHVLDALRRLGTALGDVRAVVDEGSSTPGERMGYHAAITKIDGTVREAIEGLEFMGTWRPPDG